MSLEGKVAAKAVVRRKAQFTECVFHLEEVLVKTEGLETLFERPQGETLEAYREKVKAAFASGSRTMVSREELESIRTQFGIWVGLLSRHGNEWIDAVLEACWPGFEWDFLVPAGGKTRFGRGMKDFSPDTWGLIVCGTAGQVSSCYAMDKGFAVLATWGWSCVPGLRGGPASRECWREESVFADAQIDQFSELPEVLEAPVSQLPLLERLMTRPEESVKSPRLLQSRKFGPSNSDIAFTVYGLGRYFPWSCEKRRDWRLSRSVLELKESAVFPKAWLQATALTIRDFQEFTKDASLIVTTIPARPGRVARLKAFLKQLEESGLLPSDGTVSFAPELLGFHEGVLSNHHDKLGAADRYANIRDHLYVRQPELLASKPNVVVIDDVVTTGATLYHAKRFLHKAGADLVMPLAMALTISQR